MLEARSQLREGLESGCSYVFMIEERNNKDSPRYILRSLDEAEDEDLRERGTEKVTAEPHN